MIVDTQKEKGKKKHIGKAHYSNPCYNVTMGGGGGGLGAGILLLRMEYFFFQRYKLGWENFFDQFLPTKNRKKNFFFPILGSRPFANHHAIMPRFWAFFIFFSIMPPSCHGVVGQGFRSASPGDFPPRWHA